MSVYIFDFGNQIKIGRSANAKSRLNTIEFQSGQKAQRHFTIEADGRYENLMHKLLCDYRGIGEYFTFPFDHAVSLLKNLVRFEFAKEVKPESQLFMPLEVERKVVVEKPVVVEKEVIVEKPVVVEKTLVTFGKGITISEIAKELKITVDAVRKRIETAGVKPISREAVYDKEVVKILKDVKMGRPPKKAKPEKPAKKAKK